MIIVGEKEAAKTVQRAMHDAQVSFENIKRGLTDIIGHLRTAGNHPPGPVRIDGKPETEALFEAESIIDTAEYGFKTCFDTRMEMIRTRRRYGLTIWNFGTEQGGVHYYGKISLAVRERMDDKWTTTLEWEDTVKRRMGTKTAAELNRMEGPGSRYRPGDETVRFYTADDVRKTGVEILVRMFGAEENKIVVKDLTSECILDDD